MVALLKGIQGASLPSYHFALLEQAYIHLRLYIDFECDSALSLRSV